MFSISRRFVALGLFVAGVSSANTGNVDTYNFLAPECVEAFSGQKVTVKVKREQGSFFNDKVVLDFTLVPDKFTMSTNRGLNETHTLFFSGQLETHHQGTFQHMDKGWIKIRMCMQKPRRCADHAKRIANELQEYRYRLATEKDDNRNYERDDLALLCAKKVAYSFAINVSFQEALKSFAELKGKGETLKDWKDLNIIFEKWNEKNIRSFDTSVAQ